MTERNATSRLRQAALKRAIDLVFDALLNTEVDVALEALEHVTEEFRRAQQEPDVLSAGTVTDKEERRP
jgi:hypothetical protein